MFSASQPISPLTWVLRLIFCVLFVGALYIFEQGVFSHINPYYQIIAINAGIAVILAVSLNLINGITGQFSLGHAGFMAIGAYSAAYFTKEIGHNSPLADPLVLLVGILIGAATAGVAGLIVGLPSLRLRGDYLAIVTLGFNQIIVSIIRTLDDVTRDNLVKSLTSNPNPLKLVMAKLIAFLPNVGGASGYGGIDKLTTFTWTFALVTLCLLSVRNLAQSQLGRSMRAIRDDEVAAEASGINTTKIKIIAFVFSAGWAGVAGALQAHFYQVINPGDFTFLKSVEVVVAVVLGGLGSITGSALAAVGLKCLEEVLREVPGVLWTSLGLILLSGYWNTLRLKSERKTLDAMALLTAWCVPVIALVLLLTLRFWPVAYVWLNDSKGALRYVLYSLILIVLMLLRPQGLLGRTEWSFAALRGRFTPRPSLES